jgi:hypothetical protein
MTDRAQFEAMLEALINDDTDQAKEIFHNIVVSKSREIYEELLAEDFSKDTGNPYDKNDDDDMEESDEAPMEEGDDEEDMPDEEGDSEDDMDMDMDMGDEEGEEGSDMEDRVMDLEDALEDLKAEFEQLLSQEDEEGDDMGGMDDMGGDMGSDMDSEMDEMDGMEPEPVMEYYKKVSVSHGDNGTNTKSIVAGKNDMGGTTANIAKSFSTTSGGTTGGLAKNTAGDLTKGMNVHNRVQSNAGKTAFKKSEPGHGPEKAGKKETADNKQSMLNGAPKRAK